MAETFLSRAESRKTPLAYGTLGLCLDMIDYEQDPTCLEGLEYVGVKERELIFDRRIGRWQNKRMHVLEAKFRTHLDTTGESFLLTIDVEVNLEMQQEAIETEVQMYLEALGRLPAFLLHNLRAVTLHRGCEAFGGNGDPSVRHIVIHTGYAKKYYLQSSSAQNQSKKKTKRRTLEHALIHEAAHVLEGDFMYESGKYRKQWQQAMEADGCAISHYAADNPDTEDFAETMECFLATEFRSERFSGKNALLLDRIRNQIPNRLQLLREVASMEGWTMK
eukprot:TRINITY_DN63301_c0_g1_i1.p1 TRINITY_DN63301_c0_g1~~TRINITY_DN63301_c0_g1_i1.p1  ORF type:complete len:277 (+),score=13.59 TRINITY_DN63301_c0_g1_i1:227-1057(+)